MSFFKNKILGHILALVFYMGVGYFLFIAASNMNYIWKWDSIPKYFVYDQTTTIEAPIDGTFVIENGKYYVKGEKKVEIQDLTNKYTIEYDNGDSVYKDDVLASITQTKLGPILNGLWVTVKISFFSTILLFTIGIIGAFMRLSSFYFLRDIATVYITVIRGTPLLVQIFLFYFIIANIFGLDRFWAGMLSLGIFYGAYNAEILRGAIQSIDKGQTEASKSLGISHFQTMIHIILPQAFKRALPTLVGEVICLVKDSSLVSVIAIADLTEVGREIVSNTFSPFETWIVVALVYLCITSLLSLIGHKIETHMKLKGGMS